MSKLQNRQKLLKEWLPSKLFKASNLLPSEIEDVLLHSPNNAGEFLNTFMTAIARKQHAQRWADNSPEEILYMLSIKTQIPSALFVHIIRDGRDVALSLTRKRSFLRPFPWKTSESFLGAGLYWEWIVNRGCAQGKLLGPDYIEVRFEDILSQVGHVLRRLSDFLEQDLTLERITTTPFGALKNPNTSFPKELGNTFEPVGRWKRLVSQGDVSELECYVGHTLKEHGYETAPRRRRMKMATLSVKTAYEIFFNLKLWFKKWHFLPFLRPRLRTTLLNEMTIAEDWYGQPRTYMLNADV